MYAKERAGEDKPKEGAGSAPVKMFLIIMIACP